MGRASRAHPQTDGAGVIPGRVLQLNGRKAHAACIGRWVIVQTVDRVLGVSNIIASRELDTPTQATAELRNLADALDAQAMAGAGYTLEVR